MRPEYKNGNVTANCPDCGGVRTTFEYRTATNDFGAVIQDGHLQFDGRSFSRVLYFLLRCAGCGRGGLATVHDGNTVRGTALEEFLPTSIDHAKLPAGVPPGIESEFREAERSSAFGAWRAASALLRSALERTPRANGNISGSLAAKIDVAAADGIITDSRRTRAHDEVRVLGNDVLHDEWKEVSSADVELASHYAQRILEDFYADRGSVEALLKSKGRLPQ